MGFFLIIGFFLYGWVEISAFIFISNEIGGLLTLLGVFVTAIIGITFLKNQGLSVLRRVHSDLTRGHPPVLSVADSVSLVVGAGLMIIPGYVTDAFGILLFIPGLRTMVGIYFLTKIAKKPHFTSFGNFDGGIFTQRNNKQKPFGFNEQHRQRNDFDDVIEGKFEERPETKPYLSQKNNAEHNDC